MANGGVYPCSGRSGKLKRMLQRSGAEPPDAGGYTHFHKIFMAVLARSEAACSVIVVSTIEWFVMNCQVRIAAEDHPTCSYNRISY